MIVFDLRCGAGHVFEAWFGSTSDYESQQRRSLLECPHCADKSIVKALMAPAVSRKGNQRHGDMEPMPVAKGQSLDEMTPAQARQLMQAMARMQASIEAASEDVGDAFAEEARKIHYGEADERPIIGEASLNQARELHEEGIELMPLPFPRRKRPDA